MGRIHCVALLLLCAPILARAYEIEDRWTFTKSDGGGHQRGDALTILWSIVPDGQSGAGVGSSDLVDALDDGWDVSQADRTSDLTNREWWSVMDRVYEQFDRTTGLTLTYVPERDSANLSTGLQGDIRLAGMPFTWDKGGTGGILADNYYPGSGGDMRIDTNRADNTDPDSDPSFYITSFPHFRNLLAHESGHGMGLGHESDLDSGAKSVMHTPLQSSYWGLQFDDIYALNRQYGDPLEKNGGNDSASTAHPLPGNGSGSLYSLGLDAADASVEELDSDWVGIDGSSDQDWYRVYAKKNTWLEVELTPQGPSYSMEPGDPSIDFSARSDLNLEVYDSTGDVKLMTIDLAEAGSREHLDRFAIPATGNYLLRVQGESDLQQFYRLDYQVGTAAYQPPPDSDLIFVDTFNINLSSTSDPNYNRFLNARQKHSVADSLLGIDNQGAGSTEINNDKLHLQTRGDGDSVDDNAVVNLLRNFAPQLAGERWRLRFDLELEAAANIDGFLSMQFNDDENTYWPESLSPELALRFGADGDVTARTDGQVIGQGLFDLSSVGVEVIVDETGDDMLMDVMLNGLSLVDDAPIDYESFGRYFSFKMGGATLGVTTGPLDAMIDNLVIERISGELSLLAGDFNGDGTVDSADYSVWRAGVGISFTQNDYLLWRHNFGQSVSGAADQAAPAPEPATWLLMGLGSAVAFARRRFAKTSTAARRARR